MPKPTTDATRLAPEAECAVSQVLAHREIRNASPAASRHDRTGVVKSASFSAAPVAERNYRTAESKPQAPKAPRLPKVLAIKREFRTTRPLIAKLEDEISTAWLNRGLLTLALSKEYQTRREVVEVIVRDGVKARIAELKKAA